MISSETTFNDEELLIWLRVEDTNLTDFAADRIEQLVATNEALEAKLATCERHRDAYAEMDRIGTQAVRDLEDKLAECEARLGKAVEALEFVDGDFEVVLKARTTLAEIKGESHE